MALPGAQTERRLGVPAQRVRGPVGGLLGGKDPTGAFLFREAGPPASWVSCVLAPPIATSRKPAFSAGGGGCLRLQTEQGASARGSADGAAELCRIGSGIDGFCARLVSGFSVNLTLAGIQFHYFHAPA